MNTQRTVKTPGPDHPITIEPTFARVRVSAAGAAIADTRAALTLREADYGPVQYIPRTDVDMTCLRRSEHTTHCPYKGECRYYHLTVGGDEVQNAVWTYEDPYPAVAPIRDRLAFYPDRVDGIRLGDD